MERIWAAGILKLYLRLWELYGNSLNDFEYMAVRHNKK